MDFTLQYKAYDCERMYLNSKVNKREKTELHCLSVNVRQCSLVHFNPCMNNRSNRQLHHRYRSTTVNAVAVPAITTVSDIKSNPITTVIPMACD